MRVSGVIAGALGAIAVGACSATHTNSSPRPEVATTGTVVTSQPQPVQRPAHAHPAPSLARMLGQMMVASFSGTEAPQSLLARIRTGQVGGVILFADNVAGGVSAVRALTETLQAAARQGHNPPLLIMTDQEGGEVKRLPGPPSLAASQMIAGATAFSQGQAAGRLLRSAGINLDLAPVADVERAPGSFLGSRSFGGSPSLVGQNACAFAGGLAAAHVAFTLKHFPGLGRAGGNTDVAPVAIAASSSGIRADYAAYRKCGANKLGLVMVSSATYPALTGPLPAVMSATTYSRELSVAVPGGRPLTISDDLQTPAITSQVSPARQAINAGLDLLMYAQTEEGSAAAYASLMAEARAGLVSATRVRSAYAAITALKRRLR